MIFPNRRKNLDSDRSGMTPSPFKCNAVLTYLNVGSPRASVVLTGEEGLQLAVLCKRG